MRSVGEGVSYLTTYVLCVGSFGVMWGGVGGACEGSRDGVQRVMVTYSERGTALSLA